MVLLCVSFFGYKYSRQLRQTIYAVSCVYAVSRAPCLASVSNETACSYQLRPARLDKCHQRRAEPEWLVLGFNETRRSIYNYIGEK